jgi:hypothetical protein
MYVVLLVASRVDVKPSIVESFERLFHFVYAYVVEIVRNERCLPIINVLTVQGRRFLASLTDPIGAAERLRSEHRQAAVHSGDHGTGG